MRNRVDEEMFVIADACLAVDCGLYPAQEERLTLVLGLGKPEAHPKLLQLMLSQKDKYKKWLFRLLMVLSELLVSFHAAARPCYDFDFEFFFCRVLRGIFIRYLMMDFVRCAHCSVLLPLVVRRLTTRASASPKFCCF